MAIIREPTAQDGAINYVATLAFFCCVSCAVLMLKFRGFKASLDLSAWRKREELPPSTSMIGAYRVNRDEFYGNGRISETPKKPTPSMVKLPPSFDPEPSLRPAKSTSDIAAARPITLPQQPPHRSTNDVSLDPRGAASTPNRRSAPPPPPERKQRDAKNQEKEQKRLEKQRLAEEKALEKAAAQARAKQEKLQREREKQAAQEQAKVMKRNKKKVPVPPQVETNASAKNLAPAPPPPPPQAPSYSSNTLESSISRSTGPPPYSESANTERNGLPGNSNPTNVSFGKPISNTTDSWDLISQHREQMNRPAATGLPRGPQKNMVMDLQYKLGTPQDKADNSEA